MLERFHQLGTKVLSVCTWLTKFTFLWIEMAAVCTDQVASRGSYINSLDRSHAIIRNQRIIVGDRSATNANQGCFAAFASMIKKVGRQNCERETTMITKKQDKTTCPGC